MKKRTFLIGLNLIAPGVGQLAAKMWLQGALELLASLACLLWCAVEVFAPIVVSVRNLLNGDGEIMRVNLWHVGISLAVLLVLYIWSLAEIALFVKDEDSPKL